MDRGYWQYAPGEHHAKQAHRARVAAYGKTDQSGDTGNQYPWGQCTWWSYERRHQLGLNTGSFFGDARSVVHECEARDLVRRELTLGDDAGALHVGFRDLDGAIGVDRLDDGHMAVIAVGAFLARCEHEHVAHGARRVVDPVGLRPPPRRTKAAGTSVIPTPSPMSTRSPRRRRTTARSPSAWTRTRRTCPMASIRTIPLNDLVPAALWALGAACLIPTTLLVHMKKNHAQAPMAMP